MFLQCRFYLSRVLPGKSMVGLTGLEPVTLRLSSACSNQLSYRPAMTETIGALHAAGVSNGGGKGIRTPDIQLAKLALYQLSYAPDWRPLRLTREGDPGKPAAFRIYRVANFQALKRLQKLNCAFLYNFKGFAGFRQQRLGTHEPAGMAGF